MTEHNDIVIPYIAYEIAEAIHTMMTTHTHEAEAECPAVTVWGDTAEQAVI